MSSWTYTIGDGYYYSHMALTDNATIVKEYLEDLGFSQYAIVGIIANMDHESYINPGQTEHGYDMSESYGYGLVMWTPFKKKLKLYAEGLGGNWYDGDLQLDYLMLNAPASWIVSQAYPYTWDQFKTLDDYYTATRTFFYNFERGTYHDELDTYTDFWANELYSDEAGEAGDLNPPTIEEEDETLWLAIYLSKMLR